jgi:hypothetical protein
VNWLNDVDANDELKELKQEHAKKAVSKKSPFDFKPFVGKLSTRLRVEIETKWADLSNTTAKPFNQLTNGTFQVNGKSTFKRIRNRWRN